jgi:outer membrane protein TolC
MKKLLLFILINVFCFTAFAETLDLEKARSKALSSSRSLAKINLAVKSADLEEWNQLYSMLPEVSVKYDAAISYLKAWELQNPGETYTTGVSFTITQKLFEGGKIFIQRAIAKIATESVKKDALAEYFNVLDALDNAYYAALEAQASLDAEESSLQNAVLNLSMAEIRQTNGMINAGDYLKSQADKEARENARNQARRSLSVAMAKLKTLTGLTETPELVPVDFSAYESLIARLSVVSDEQIDDLFDALWKIIAAENPSLAKSALSTERAEKNYSIAKREWSPTVSATVFGSSYNYSAESGFRESARGGVTISGSIPVDFWVLSNKLKRSKISRDSALLDYTGAEINLETELQSALLNILTQSETVLSSRRSLEYTQKHFDYVMERYRLSQSSVSDAQEASLLLINSRNSNIKASYGFLQSLSKLRSMGAFQDEAKLIRILMGN